MLLKAKDPLSVSGEKINNLQEKDNLQVTCGCLRTSVFWAPRTSLAASFPVHPSLHTVLFARPTQDSLLVWIPFAGP